jgi:hypothetical protein
MGQLRRKVIHLGSQPVGIRAWTGRHCAMASVRATRHERHREAKVVTSKEHGEETGKEIRVPLKNATYVGSSKRMRYVPTYLLSLDGIYDGIKGNNPRSMHYVLKYLTSLSFLIAHHSRPSPRTMTVTTVPSCHNSSHKGSVYRSPRPSLPLPQLASRSTERRL